MSTKALAACQRGSGMIREAMALLEEHFVDEELPEPFGWCPLAALDLLDQAIGMLEPLEEEDENPPRLRVVVDNTVLR